MRALFLLPLALAAQSPPKTVKKGSDKYLGGGSAETPGHLKPMQEVRAADGAAHEVQGWPTPEKLFEFYTEFRPVVFRGALLGERPFKLWDDAYLREQFGEIVVDVEEGKVEDRLGPEPEEMRLADYLDEYSKEGYDKYLVQDVLRLQLDDWPVPPPLRCPEMYKGLQMIVMWFSGGGTSSVLHNDPHENLLCLLDGSKSLMLVHPQWTKTPDSGVYWRLAEVGGTSPVNQEQVDLVMFPRFADVNWTSAELGRGDCIYIPRSYLHQVRSSSGRNLAVNFWWAQNGGKKKGAEKLACKKRLKDRDPVSKFPIASPEWQTSQALHDLRSERRKEGLPELSRDELLEQIGGGGRNEL